MSGPKTVAEYQLTRKQEDDFDSHTYAFMTPFLPGGLPTWTPYGIAMSMSTGTLRQLHEYLVSLEAQAYIVATAFLHEPGKPEARRTEMRLSDMIVDSYIAAGGKPETLRFLGINWIVNQGALEAIDGEFAHAVPEPVVVAEEGGEARVVKITPAGKSDNPFTRCAVRVAEGLSAASGVRVVLKTVSMIRTAKFVYHMVCEFQLEEPASVAPAAVQTEKKGLIKRTFSKKGRDTIKRTLSHLVRKKN